MFKTFPFSRRKIIEEIFMHKMGLNETNFFCVVYLMTPTLTQILHKEEFCDLYI